MSTAAAHRICRVVLACLVLAGLGSRTPGKACCGEGSATTAGELAAAAPVQKAGAGGCNHCSKEDASPPAPAAEGDSCPSGPARDCDGGPADNDPCNGGACAALCCHLNAVTTAPPAITAVAEVAVEVALGDLPLPPLADGDAIFHPPRA